MYRVGKRLANCGVARLVAGEERRRMAQAVHQRGEETAWRGVALEDAVEVFAQQRLDGLAQQCTRRHLVDRRCGAIAGHREVPVLEQARRLGRVATRRLARLDERGYKLAG